MKGALFALVLCLWSSTALAQELGVDLPEPAPPARPDVSDAFGWRLGLLDSGLVDSGQGRPFLYPTAGLRYKTSEIYLDVHLPVFFAGLDFLSYTAQQRVFAVNRPFDLFEALNQPIQYGAYLEVAHLRLGQTFTFHPFAGGAPLRLTGGIAGVFDFVFFDLALFHRDPEDFKSINLPGAHDPVVVAPGGFVALGGDAPYTEYDLAIGAGPDLYQDDAYEPSSGWVIFADLDVVFDVLDDVAVQLRWRTSTYTHITSQLILTMAVDYGIVVRFW